VSSNNALDSLWKTTGKFVFAVLSETVAVVASVASATSIFAEPSNEVPPIVLAVVRVAALPDVF
jgi:hypothetical protein